MKTEKQNTPSVPYGYTADGDPDHGELICCHDMSCPCHTDQERIGQIADFVNQGLASPADADRMYRGKVV